MDDRVAIWPLLVDAGVKFDLDARFSALGGFARRINDDEVIRPKVALAGAFGCADDLLRAQPNADVAFCRTDKAPLPQASPDFANGGAQLQFHAHKAYYAK